MGKNEEKMKKIEKKVERRIDELEKKYNIHIYKRRPDGKKEIDPERYNFVTNADEEIIFYGFIIFVSFILILFIYIIFRNYQNIIETIVEIIIEMDFERILVCGIVLIIFPLLPIFFLVLAYHTRPKLIFMNTDCIRYFIGYHLKFTIKWPDIKKVKVSHRKNTIIFTLKNKNVHAIRGFSTHEFLGPSLELEKYAKKHDFKIILL